MDKLLGKDWKLPIDRCGEDGDIEAKDDGGKDEMLLLRVFDPRKKPYSIKSRMLELLIRDELWSSTSDEYDDEKKNEPLTVQ